MDDCKGCVYAGTHWTKHPCVHCKRAWFDHYEEEKMTEKDMMVEEQRRTIRRLETELRDAKAMLHRMSKYVPDEVMAHLALEMTAPSKVPSGADEAFWRGE